MKKKKILAVLLSAAILTGVLGGCGSEPEKEADGGSQISGEEAAADAGEEQQAEAEEDASGETASGDKKKVVLWTWATGQFDAVIDAYFESHPDADWELEEVVVAAEDYLTKLQQGYASGGDMPDLLMAEMGWRGSAFALDIWENLEEAPYNFDRSVVMDSVIGGMVNSQDQVIGIENSLNPAFMMYKKDLAKEYLGTDDRAELEAMFKTYDDYAEIGAEVYEKSNGAVTLFPGLQDVSNMMMMQKRNVSNVDAEGNVDVSGKVQNVFETVEAMRDAKACGNLAQYSTEWSNSFAESSCILYPAAAWSVTYWVEPYDPEYTKGTRPNFGSQEINSFMMEEISPNLPEASLSIYDNLVSDSVNMVVQMMAADESMTAEDAMDEFMTDLQSKIPDVTVK